MKNYESSAEEDEERTTEYCEEASDAGVKGTDTTSPDVVERRPGTDHIQMSYVEDVLVEWHGEEEIEVWQPWPFA